ncbi:MAG: HEAT repeat domain-containing protein, partial [Verrucomicrobiota bacterium]|nr:HEAT repeat domain-containing protein [Verrucomicrobiota bacterium]
MESVSVWVRLASLTGVFLLAPPSSFAEPAPLTVAQLAKQLTGADLTARRDAGYQLGKFGADAKDAVPALIKALDDPDKQVWSYAAAALAAIGPDAADAIPALLENLNSRKARGQRPRDKDQALFRSAYALTQIGPAAIPPLIAALGSEDTPLRRGATKALGGMGAAARSGIPALIANLEQPDEALRREVIEALGLIGPEAIPPLVEALGSPDPRPRAGAALALAAI